MSAPEQYTPYSPTGGRLPVDEAQRLATLLAIGGAISPPTRASRAGSWLYTAIGVTVIIILTRVLFWHAF